MTAKEKAKKSEKDRETKKRKTQKEKVEELKSQVKQLEKELEVLNDKYVRLAAEFDNFKKRKEREFKNILQTANRDVFLELLPVIDDFERSLNTKTRKQSLKSFREGVELIYKKLITILQKFGLEAIESLDHPFDPELHEAMMQVEVKEKDSNIIVEEVQKGYKLNDFVLRHAKVIVNK